MKDRAAAIAAAMGDIRTIEAELGVTRSGVEAIRDRLVELVSERELFPLDDFPPPGDDEEQRSCLHRLAQDPDGRFALYANASRGSVSTPVHDHTTWAAVVGFEGTELNRFYRRGDGDRPEQIGEHLVEAGTGVALLPEDLHDIRIEGRALNFHCYGLGLEHLDQRRYYHAASDSWRVFPAHADIREARPEPRP